MYKYLSIIGIIGVLSLTIVSCSNSDKKNNEEWVDPLEETAEQKDARMEWWREARFGLFIHWGVYAVPAGIHNGEEIPAKGEWIMRRAEIPVKTYKSYAKDFNPVKYDPKAWVKMAKDAGMKYIVITSKHHDGFALFDSKVTDWDVVDATPYGKDLLKPLVKAAKKEGLKIGFYYSQAQDWTHPGGAKAGFKEGEYWDEAHAGSFDEYLKNIAYPQVKEILSNYDIDVLWWDTPHWMTKERAEILRPLLALEPGIITNNRLGGGYRGDTQTPEQWVPATGIEGRDWEVCMTMNHTWGYKLHDDNWKSSEYLIQKLVDIASKGGNFLLNVGPKPDGTIPQVSIERLKNIGDWMKVYHESIYGSSASPFRRPLWGRCTQKEMDNGDTRLFLHVFDWPDDNVLKVPVSNQSIQCYSLSDPDRTYTVRRTDDGLLVQLSGDPDNKVCSVIVLDLKGEADVQQQIISGDEQGVMTLKPEESDLENRGYVSSNHAELIRNEEFSYITWKEIRTWMQWPVHIDTEGSYNVYLTLATNSADNSIILKNGENEQKFILPNTGGLKNFCRVKLGTVDMSAGNTVIMIKSDDDDWQESYVGHIEFVPDTGV